ncbi:hypothetical protein INT43_002822 [Umbelopsis isabellina]|uniref:CUE domain-containing protein n=1 Tax=Mortierella isabellina TaxID=91625 RepID=A0A8H7UPM2_MORIS|nr:hypothetical protein INT43_002822 [Umbelopsis isabellina]
MYEQALQSLKEAFPTVDPVVVEAILESHRGQADRCFEPLLRISDPSYKPDPPQRQQSPRSQHSERSPDQPQQQEEGEEQPLSPEEQMRRDEEYARQLALEDERERVRLHQQRGNARPNNRPPAPERENSQGFMTQFEQELPVIKERVMEAGTAAKNKMMQWYSQIKEQSQQSSNPNTMPPTNAQYRGLSRDDRDDLLSGDMSALHLSENDVYTRTTGQPFPQRQVSDASDWDDRLGKRPGQQQGSPQSNTVHVNPPSSGPRQPQYKTSTSMDQLTADEELARSLAYEEDHFTPPPPMPSRPSRTGSVNSGAPVHSPAQNFSTSPKANDSPVSRSIEVNPPADEDNEAVKPYAISPKPNATTENPSEPIRTEQVNKKDLSDVDDDDIGLIDVDEDEDDDLETTKATSKPNEKAENQI